MKRLAPLACILLLGLAACTPSVQQNTHFTDAQTQLQNYQYTDALESLYESIEEYPEYTTAYVEAARLHIAKSQYQEAIDVLDQAREQKETPEILTLIGDAYYEQGKPNKAKEFYDQALDKQSDYSPAIIGALTVRSIDNSDRVEFAKSVSVPDQEVAILSSIAMLPDDTQAAIDRLKQAKTGSNTSRAELATELISLVRKYQKDEALLSLAEISYTVLDNEWYEFALPLTNKMIAMNEFYEGGYVYKAVIQINTARYRNAEDLLKRALSINSNDSNARILLVEAYLAQGKVQAARGLVAKIPVAEVDIQTVVELLRVMDSYGEYQSILDIISAIPEDSTRTTELQLLEIRALVETEAYEQALTKVELLLPEEASLSITDQSELNVLAAFAYFYNDQKAEAQEYATRAQVVDRTNPESYYVEAVILVDQENYDGASESLNRAIELDFRGKITDNSNRILETL